MTGETPQGPAPEHGRERPWLFIAMGAIAALALGAGAVVAFGPDALRFALSTQERPATAPRVPTPPPVPASQPAAVPAASSGQGASAQRPMQTPLVVAPDASTPDLAPASLPDVVSSGTAVGTRSVRPRAPEGYREVFFDDFDTFDESAWTKLEPANVGGGLEYNPVNVSVGGSRLRITQRRVGRRIEGGGVYSFRKRQWEQGYFAARIRPAHPQSPGTHTGFWMMPYPTGPTTHYERGEIDIAEIAGIRPRTAMHTLHVKDINPHLKDAYRHLVSDHMDDHGVNMFADFHVHALEWSPEGFRWYLDGRLMFQTDRRGDTHPFNRPFFIWLTSVATWKRGEWTGVLPRGAPLPVAEFDWVQVAQKEPR